MLSLLRCLLPWILAAILLVLFVLWLLLSTFFTFPYSYSLNTIYTCWGLGIIIILTIYALLIYNHGWRSLFKNFWASLGVISIVGLLTSACLFYSSWLSLLFTPAETTTVQVLQQYNSGGRNGCIQWKIRLENAEQLRPFCTTQSIPIGSPTTYVKVKLKRNWLVTEVVYLAPQS